MSHIYKYIFSETKTNNEFTVSTVEHITAGTIAQTFCNDPVFTELFSGTLIVNNTTCANEFFKDIDDKNNAFSSLFMAKAATAKFKTRIGLSASGYIIPIAKSLTEVIVIKKELCAYICLYDSVSDKEIIHKIPLKYDPTMNSRMQRSTIQVKISLMCKQLYNDYVKECKKKLVK